MTREEVQPLFLSQDFIKPKYTVFRLDTGSGRWYYTFDEEGKPQFYQSVTTFIRNSLPTAPSLIKWMCDMGYEKSQEYTNLRADYGTFMHAMFADFVKDGHYDTDTLEAQLKTYLEVRKHPLELLNGWLEDLNKDLRAFAQFIVDYEVEPLAMEITLVSPTYGIAGTLDMPCIMNAKLYTDKTEKEKRKRIRACIDFKSGRKGFHEEHEVQLEACKLLWQENFPEEEQLDKIFNWSPKDWRDKPTYNLKDQSDSVNLEKLKLFIQIAEIEGKKKLPMIKQYGGIIKYGEAPGNTYKTISVEEYIRNDHAKTTELLPEVREDIVESNGN